MDIYNHSIIHSNRNMLKYNVVYRNRDMFNNSTININIEILNSSVTILTRIGLNIISSKEIGTCLSIVSP